MLFNQIPLTPAAPDSIPAPAQEISMLKNLSIDELLNKLITTMVDFAIHLAIAIFVFYVGKFIIRKIYNVVTAILLRRNVDKSLSTFILSLIRILLYFILVVTVIGILGINTSSFIAIFASAGVAIGMALSGTLQNFAGGVLILLLKPYKIGDYIETQGYAGTVTEIQIFSTIICTADNKSIIIPNGGLSTGSINNWSREDYRRVQWDIAISYGDDVAVARKAIIDMLNADERIVKHTIESDREQRREQQLAAQPHQDIPATDEKRSWLSRMLHRKHSKIKERLEATDIQTPDRLTGFRTDVDRSPVVFLAQLADSSVNLTARAWVRSADYWTVYYDFNERIYNTLPLHGISFPFPQLDIHLPTPNAMNDSSSTPSA